MPNLVIESWTTDRLTPYGNNPRKNDHAVDRMVTAIREFGFRIPLVAKSNGELIDGHLRLKAAIAMGMDSVPVIIADDLSVEQVKAFRLMVNRSATWATWDENLLALEISSLLESQYDLLLTGFDQSELDALLKESLATEKDPNALPEVTESPVVQFGELWILENHRVLCGDSLKKEHVDYLLNGKQADMIWSDPPYNVDYEGKAGKIKNDKMSATAFTHFLDATFKQMSAVLIPGGAIYISHAEVGEGLAFRQAFKRADFYFSSCLIWNKGQAVLSRADYHWQHEPILYGWKKGAAHKWHGNRKQKSILEYQHASITQQQDNTWALLIDGKLYKLSGENITLEEMPTTIIDVPKPNKSELHPTTKPVELIERCVSNSSRSGDLVLDLFGGSGSTLMACENLGRSCCSMELDPRFAQVEIVRWQNFTGKQAMRESDGKLFDEIISQ